MSVPASDLSRVRLLIFDLDGTLIDSKLDLALSVNAMREQLGLGALPHDVIATYVGQGVEKLVQRSLDEGATEESLAKSLAFFREYYRQHMLDNTEPYPGVREALEELRGRSMAVLSNKPVKHSREILSGLGLAHYFSAVYGGNSFAQKKPDPAGALALMRENNASPEETLMIGDSETDVLTGRNAGVRTCGVTYGFGAPTLQNAPPDWTINDLRELPRLVNGRGAGKSAK
jgi:phosphoglycolate phosphatase